ncbi:lysophospholipid acyltransferase family protein [Edaphobacter albus]|uniref:lysophospholipid acyltransferase family protein n=1 Tax=Edaphobacter sp. 4G125 TaxID=2763071 RepID=UPI001647410D|nr:lysophospholipid acyltransferase family protein [Edaphobacter sp. 4G125]QNI38306.1 1-acyl-sn-glycerol-3-phosphate acyltransferase [Edaphobacter sp. 4G125]
MLKLRWARSAWRILHVTGLLLVLGIDFFLRPARSAAEGAEKIHRYCRRLVRALGVEWSVKGRFPEYGALVSNHLSYLDILLYAAIRPFIMVAKAEVRGWPGIGWLTKQAGTVFVVRGGGPPSYPAVNHAMAEAYRSGVPVLFFPEGTTTNGSETLPFRRGLFHSVLNEGVALQTAALAYSVEEEEYSVANDVCWWGDALLFPHIVRLASMRRVQARVRFGAVVQEREDRFVLSAQAREQIVDMVAELSFATAVVVDGTQETKLVEAL